MVLVIVILTAGLFAHPSLEKEGLIRVERVLCGDSHVNLAHPPTHTTGVQSLRASPWQQKLGRHYLWRVEVVAQALESVMTSW
jgi:hypothetical protein